MCGNFVNVLPVGLPSSLPPSLPSLLPLFTRHVIFKLFWSDWGTTNKGSQNTLKKYRNPGDNAILSGLNEVPFCPAEFLPLPSSLLLCLQLGNPTRDRGLLRKNICWNLLFSLWSLKATVVFSSGISFSGHVALASCCDLSGGTNSTELQQRSEDSCEWEVGGEPVRSCVRHMGHAGRLPWQLTPGSATWACPTSQPCTGALGKTWG